MQEVRRWSKDNSNYTLEDVLEKYISWGYSIVSVVVLRYSRKKHTAKEVLIVINTNII